METYKIHFETYIGFESVDVKQLVIEIDFWNKKDAIFCRPFCFLQLFTFEHIILKSKYSTYVMSKKVQENQYNHLDKYR